MFDKIGQIFGMLKNLPKLREEMGPGAVCILIGARMVTRSADSQFPFRQDSDFWYLTGFDHPNAIAVLRTDGGPEYALYVEPRDPDAETWTGYRPGVEGARRDHEADEAFPSQEFPTRLPDLIAGAKRVYHVLGRDVAIDAKIVETCESMRLRSRLGRIPTKAEYMADIGVINEKGAEIYRYMNFDQIEEYQDVARTVAA